jgi:molecular chaperone GrpE
MDTNTAQATPEDDAQENFAQETELTVEQEIELLKAEIESTREQALRAMAEADNIRKRVEREKADAIDYAITKFARDLLGVADIFHRALQSVPQTDDTVVKNFITGVQMTEQELQKVFEKHGVKKVAALGAPFNHDHHQAVMEVEVGEHPAGHVAQVLQEGYTLQSRLLRPAMVAVAKGDVVA